MGIAEKSKGVLTAIFGIIITVFGWFMVTAMSETLPSDSLRAIFWIGIIGFWASAVIINPILMIWGGKGNLKGSLYGLISFITSYVISIVLWYTLGHTLEALNGVFPNSTFLGIGWMAIFVIATVGMIIIPIGLTFKEQIKL